MTYTRDALRRVESFVETIDSVTREVEYDEETCCANLECTWIDEDCEDNAI